MPRILIIHPEAEVRSSLEEAVRAVGATPLVVESTASLVDGLRRARVIQPHVVLLDIGGERSLVLEGVADLRAPGCQIIGLYNPIILRVDLAFLKDATRAGVRDFIFLPVSGAELSAALFAADNPEGKGLSEGRVISLFSQKGGVGTTTLAVNIGLLLASSDEVKGEVALLDAALQFGVADSFLGLKPQSDIAELVRDPQGGAALSACLTEDPYTGLKLLAAPRDPIEGDRITPEDFTRALIELRRRFPWVVVDTPSTLDRLTVAVLDASDRIFIVTEAVTPAILGTARLLKLLDDERLSGDRVRIVLNRFSSFKGNLSLTMVTDLLGREVDHVVPYDRNFVIAATGGRPLIGDRPAAAVEAALSGIGEDVVALRRQHTAVAA